MKMLDQYIQLTNKKPDSKKYAKIYSPKPTLLDYKKGYIIRYFAKQVNDENAPITEISRGQYKSWSDDDSGLDNGFYTYEILGPVTKVELFTEEEIKRLNLPESAKKPTYKAIYIYPSFFPYKYNVKAARKWGVLAYGGNKNDSESWYRIKENYEGKTGHFTTYTNYKGETWTENYKKTIYD